MAELPPPRQPDPTDEDRLAARLAALAERRPDPHPTGQVPASTTDEDRLAARLAALAERRATNPSSPVAATSSTRTRSKRHHPAKGARAAALGLSLASTGGLAALFALTNGQSATELQSAQIVSTTPAVANVTTVTNGAAPKLATSSGGAVASAAPAQPVDLTLPAATTVVDGGTFHNKWGDVQVQATFGADGTLLDVSTLQTPYRDGKSVRINDRAVPRLNSEALAAQSANVDTVSGATYTSNDYRRSLQSAIDAAAQAGIVVTAA